MATTISYSLATINDAVTLVLGVVVSLPQPTCILALHGDLGAGKTTFVQALGAKLGVEDLVTSPTFTILKRFETKHQLWPHLVHIDAYRIETVAELKPLAFEEYVTTPGTLSCIEWPERVAVALPAHTLHLYFSILSESARRIEILDVSNT
jgi:tRNA threonylcarbamoyladenosine biosynthesis protein TsaE